MKYTILAMIIIILSACAPKPVTLVVKQEQDIYLSCDQLKQQISQAQHYKKEARKDDRFKMSYMFPPTGFMAIYNINKAEGRAVRRIEYLEALFKQKGCNIPTPYMPPSMNNQRRDYYNAPPPYSVYGR
jgi:hypothetical protein